jgi:hypothetical protein
LVLALAFCVGLAANAMAIEESERVGMEFRAGYSYQAQKDIGSGPCYGLRILFITPTRLAGYVGGEIYGSHGKPLGEVFSPGWSLLKAESSIFIMPATIGVTYTLSSKKTNAYLGGGPAWVTLHERTKATYVSDDYVLTEWTNNGGSGPGIQLSAGMRYMFNPDFSAFSEVEGFSSWIDYGEKEIASRSIALFVGIRF